METNQQTDPLDLFFKLRGDVIDDRLLDLLDISMSLIDRQRPLSAVRSPAPPRP